MRTVLLTLIVCLCVQPASAKYSGGTGEPNDPYQIATAADLIALGETPADYDKHFILTADINLDPNLPGNRVFDRAVIAPDTDDAAVGFRGTAFTGVFDGNNHVICNLTIRGRDYLGLFGQLSSIAVITDLGLEAVGIRGGGSDVGGLVGDNGSVVSNSYSTGVVGGTSSVGVLAGHNSGGIISSYSTGIVKAGSSGGGFVGHNSGSIRNSYSTAMVGGDHRIGGLVGLNSGNISDSFSAGVVSGYSSVGGLVGSIWRWDRTVSGSSTSCYWDVQASGQTTSDGGSGLTTAQMQEIGTYLRAGWDFADEFANGSCDFWRMSLGGYPELRYLTGDRPVMPEGRGTKEEPYLIRDTRDLGTAWFRPTAHYRLEASIDLTAVTWSGAIIPCFLGSLDGNGHTISNLHVEGGDYVAMIGQLRNGAAISNVELQATDINGTGDYVAAVVGENSGSIVNCSTAGTVTGDSQVGGLAGSNLGSISTCCSAATVSGGWKVGGLVGASASSITDCYSTGVVSGTTWVGNLVGDNSGDISHSHSSGTLSADSWAGGLVGRNSYSGKISDSYSTSGVSGKSSVGGLSGYNFGSISNSYSAGAASGNLSVGGLLGTNAGRITDCHSDAGVSGDCFVGGLVGENVTYNGGYGSVSNSYSTGAVTGNSSVGGLVGTTLSSITDCYSTAVVTGNSNVGGLVGEIAQGSRGWGIVVASFWDVQISGQATSDGGTGKTTVEMQTAKTFLDAGWDFVGETANDTEDIWWIDEGKDYPRLWWEQGDEASP